MADPQIDMKSVSDRFALEEAVKNASFSDEDILKLSTSPIEIRFEEGKLYDSGPEHGVNAILSA